MATHDQTPPFFKRGLPPAARLTIYLALSFSLLVADLRLHYLETLRQALSVLSYPLQIAASSPADFVHNASDYFSGLISLQRENKKLKTQQLNLASQVLFTEQLRRENIELRGLLDMQAALKVRSTAAEIIFTARDPFSRQGHPEQGQPAGHRARLTGGGSAGGDRPGHSRVPAARRGHAALRQGTGPFP